MKFQQRDIILVPFPFSDQSGKKVRPVIIVSNNKFNDFSADIIVCAITTNIIKDHYTIKIDNTELEENNIKEECCIKVENILKIDKKLIIKKIDRIKENKFVKIIKIINSLF